MKRRIVSILMALTMALSLLPAQVLAQELTQLSQNSAYTTGEDAVPLTYGNGQDTALLRSVALQNIGPDEAAVENDLYEKMSNQVSLIKLIADIDVGTLTIYYPVTIDLNGHVLRAPYGGSVIKIENGGHLTIIDSNPTAEHKFTPNADGLWVLDETNGTETVYGGVITGGTGVTITDGNTNGISDNSICGGGVLIESGGKLTMTGGNIVGCTAAGENAAGGGVFVSTNGTFEMSGGSITGCTAVTTASNNAAWGGGIRNSGSTTLSGTAVIQDCHAKGGSVYYTYNLSGGGISDGGTLNISGDVTIIGCTADGNSDAMLIYAYNNSSVTGGTFYGSIKDYGKKITGLTVTYQVNGADYATQILQSGSLATKPTDPTNSANTAFLGWDKADGTSYDFTQPVTENLTLTARFAAVTEKVGDYKELTAALANKNVDIIQLKSDVSITSTLNITRPVTLDLYGYMLEMADNASGSVITIKADGHLTLEDSDPDAEYKFNVNADGLWKWVASGGTEIVHGGVIYGGTGTEKYYSTYGGGVLIEPGGQFTMNGGNIVGCKADGSGGGVVVECVDPNGTFTMNGGAIIGCVADSGGGVETDGGGPEEYGQFIMNGGVIDSCVATGRTGGGGVRNDGLFIMGKDAAIKNCKAVEYGERNIGSGIALAGDGQQTINGTIISADAADEKYIFMNRGTVAIGADADIHANITLEGGTIALADGVTSATVYGKITDGCYADGLVTVTYQVNGADYATQILRSGSTATRPTDPTKSGYDFAGWFTPDGAAYDFTAAVTENITLTGWLYKGVKTADEFAAALNDSNIDVIRLMNDITLHRKSGSTLIGNGRKVILDLNGYVLDLGERYIAVGGTTPGTLTIMDSRPNASHKFTPNDDGLWVWDKGVGTGTETVLGGVITSSESTNDGAIHVSSTGQLIMNGGNIVGHKNHDGWGGGVYVSTGTFTMNGGSIVGCTAKDGGDAICLRGGRMNANGGTVDGTVVLESSGTIQGGGSTFTGLIINNNPQAQFSGAHSPLGIVGEKPTGVSGHTYCTVTFDPADSTMERTTRYFLQGKNISSEIRPAPRTGYIFAGWYNGENEWDHSSGVAEDMTLTAKWNKCDHKTSTNQPTCTDAATCTVCGGTIPARGHTWSEWTPSSNNTHTRTCTVDKFVERKACADPDKDHKCDTCGAVLSQCADADKDHKCDYCGKTLSQCADANKDHKCDYCGKILSQCNDADKDHKCDYCGATLSQCDDADKDHKCDYCGATLSQCNDTDKDHKCDYCDKTLSQCNDADKDHKCDYCGAVLSQCNDADKDHKCDYCGAVLSQCADADKDHKCDYCGATMSQCDDANKDHKCDYCGKTLSQCGDANKDHVCDYCGKTISNHADANKDHVCDYCGKTISNHADTDKDHVCDYCGKTTSNHEDANKDHVCDYCGKAISNHEDADKDHNCDLCGKVLTVHTGGTATCIAPAVCEICGQSYGDIDPAVHADLRHIPAKAATTEAVGNIEYWYCAGCDQYYQDAAAKLQITQADTVTPQRIPHHYSGPTIMVVGTSYYDGGNIGLTFISSAAYSGFKGVQVDGETLAAKSYTSRENGGSQVYLKPDYLRGLTNGDHIVTILSAEGDVAAVFTVSVTGVSGSKDKPHYLRPRRHRLRGGGSGVPDRPDLPAPQAPRGRLTPEENSRRTDFGEKSNSMKNRIRGESEFKERG